MTDTEGEALTTLAAHTARRGLKPAGSTAPRRSGLDWEASWRGDPTARPSAGHGLTEHYQEGIGWDTDVPAEFLRGMEQGKLTGARPNQNGNVFDKPRKETMRERAHAGSASWVEAPDHLDAFAAGSADDRGGNAWQGGERTYAHEVRDGGHYSRPSHARIDD
jgi:hypothetical protein